MIKAKIKGNSVSIKARAYKKQKLVEIVREIAFSAAALINEISNGPDDYMYVKNLVIDELMKFSLTEDGRFFDMSAWNEEVDF